MRWEPQAGFLLLDQHLRRLERSARFFQFRCDRHFVWAKLEAAVENVARVPMKVRLMLSGSGNVKANAVPLDADPLPSHALVSFASTPVDKGEPMLLHKTTDRTLYQEQLNSRPGCYDVLLWNDAGFVTELTRFNVLAYSENRWITPPVEHGLLEGTLRQELLRLRLVTEAGLTKPGLRSAQALAVVNSVRGLLQLRPHAHDTWLLEPVGRTKSEGFPLFQPLIDGIQQIVNGPCGHAFYSNFQNG